MLTGPAVTLRRLSLLLAVVWVVLLFVVVAMLRAGTVNLRPPAQPAYVLTGYTTSISDTSTAGCVPGDECVVTLSPAGWEAVAAVGSALVLLLTANLWVGLRR